MKSAFGILVVLAFIATATWLSFIARDISNNRAEIERLKKNSEEIVNWDSIISANERKLLDSIGRVSESLSKAKQDLHNENTKLRRQNEQLEKRFHAITINDRPDF